MVVLHPLSDFIDNYTVSNSSPNYWYEGRCDNGEFIKLPRTSLAEAIASNLMQDLAQNDLYYREGKMYGILLVELPNGEQRVIKAFSGLLNGESIVDGWVTSISGRDEVALEEFQTLGHLSTIKEELISLKQLPQRQEYESCKSEFEQQLKYLSDHHHDYKQQRCQKRQIFRETLTPEALAIALEHLDEESRQQKSERRRLKHQQNQVLQPLKQIIDNADLKIRELKQQRKQLSCQLQTRMHAAYKVMNFLGNSLSLQQLMPSGLPTGTGDCCAPKLLHYAATHNLKPLSMAEFWWGASNQDKIPGEFYSACVERCQPLMGFLLSGLKPNVTEEILPIIYEDEWLIAVNKPPGLLSVPGRYRDRQDSVLSRLHHLLTDNITLASVHRLDQQTSGILILARDRSSHSQLSQQFQQRQIHKVYEAVLSGLIKADRGTIELPLWGDPQNRPLQQVDERGKLSLTHFQVIAREGNYTRVEFTPLTGRTHQIRVHAADAKGMGTPILGDRLYGCNQLTNRLHLHARELRFRHPQTGETLHLKADTPF